MVSGAAPAGSCLHGDHRAGPWVYLPCPSPPAQVELAAAELVRLPVTPEALLRAQGWNQRWGRWSLLFSWLPVIGAPLTVVAGVMREPFPLFLALVTLAKVERYLVLAAVTLD